MKNLKYEATKLIGVNGKAFVNMDPFLKTADFVALESEANVGFAKSRNFTHAYILGETCPWEKDRFPQPLEAEIFADIDHYDPSGKHRTLMQGMKAQEKRRYVYFALKAHSPWYATLYLRHEHFRAKTESNLNNDWAPDAAHFPLLVNYIESLQESLFESIGRVLFFISYPGVATICHRDFFVEDHRDHSINIYLKESRKAYVWDGLKNNKIYLDPGIRSYFFNNRDFHGVDAESYFNYTLRIDGQFKQTVLDQIGIPSGILNIS